MSVLTAFCFDTADACSCCDCSAVDVKRDQQLLAKYAKMAGKYVLGQSRVQQVSSPRSFMRTHCHFTTLPNNVCMHLTLTCLQKSRQCDDSFSGSFGISLVLHVCSKATDTCFRLFAATGTHPTTTHSFTWLLSLTDQFIKGDLSKAGCNKGGAVTCSTKEVA